MPDDPRPSDTADTNGDEGSVIRADWSGDLASIDRVFHNLASVGVAAKEIRTYLRNHLTTLATQQDIYNCIAQGKRDLAKGQSNIYALANELGTEAYLKSYPDLLILDCTYKTNKYKMPLLDIQWKEFYQNWHEIVGSRDDEAFEERIQRLKDRYSLDYAREVGYIIETWLNLYKEKLFKVWVNRHLHFGNVVTSRGEGIHELIKIYLNTSQLDLFEAWRSIKLAVLNQLAELQANQAKQQIRTPIELSGTLYSSIRGWVSHEALREVEEQRKRLLKNDLPGCTGNFTTTFGLPCAHALESLFTCRSYITTNSSIRADLVDDSFAYYARGSGLFDTTSSAYAAIIARFVFGDPDSADIKIAREAAFTAAVDASTGVARYFSDTHTNKADIQGP
ncbi:hypothetical protein IF1G_11052 [Cordyceps javanica]|uniref:Uncharacterized protein n=1 Tax=Cordyceps javanica TaxID=43265 RepID=A0A545ULF3_9HYPO|nr:hypothetical protein IF1G_11052 [Cordyceps javanica]